MPQMDGLNPMLIVVRWLCQNLNTSTDDIRKYTWNIRKITRGIQQLACFLSSVSMNNTIQRRENVSMIYNSNKTFANTITNQTYCTRSILGLHQTSEVLGYVCWLYRIGEVKVDLVTGGQLLPLPDEHALLATSLLGFLQALGT